MKKTEQHTNIAQLNIFIADNAHTNIFNGYYTLVFQKELAAIACNKDVKGATLRVLVYLIANVDNHNHITVTTKQLVENLHFSPPTIYRALEDLILMKLLCRAGGRKDGRYELTSKLLNPRLALYGNSHKMLKTNTPIILCPDGETPILPDQVCLEDPFKELPDEQI